MAEIYTTKIYCKSKKQQAAVADVLTTRGVPFSLHKRSLWIEAQEMSKADHEVVREVFREYNAQPNALPLP